MILADTSGLLAFFNDAEPAHEAAKMVIAGEREAIVVSPFVIAELDYLITTRLGVRAELAALGELAGGAYDLAAITAGDLGKCAGLVERYHDQVIGVTDASLVVLGERYGTRTILSLDHRHFDVVRPLQGGRFKLVP